MSKRKKRLQRIRQNPDNVSFEDLRNILGDYGFILERSSGSHHSFKVKISGEFRLFVVPYRRPVKSVYVKEALQMIDEIEQERKNVGENTEDNDESDDE